MDGFGYNPDAYGNAIRAAKKPNLEKYLKGPHTLIGASGLDVGLPDGQMGNSEVGHTNIGAGRIVYQMLVKITKDIENGTFKAPHTVHHTHEGSIGNLCTQQIAALMDAQLARFHFERVEAAEAALVQP